jgi:hypothetical protein
LSVVNATFFMRVLLRCVVSSGFSFLRSEAKAFNSYDAVLECH